MKKLLLVTLLVLMMCCCVSAQQCPLFGEPLVLSSPAIVDVPAGMDEFILFLQEFSTTSVGRVICILLLLVLLPLVLGLYLLVPAFVVFLVMFVFNFDALRKWFNKKAGANVVFYDRLDKRLWRVPVLIGLLAVAVLIVREWPSAAIPVVLVMLIYCIVRVRMRVAEYGSRKAAWLEIIYVLFAGYAVFMLCILFFWAIIIYFGVKLITEPSASSGSSGKGGGYTCYHCVYHDSSEDWCHARKMRAYSGDSACGSLRLTK